MDDNLIRSWDRSNSTAENIAADTAIGIRMGRIKSVPPAAVIANEWAASPRTVYEAWKLLADNGVFKKDETGRYYLP